MTFGSGAARLLVVFLALAATTVTAKVAPEAKLDLGQAATAADFQTQRQQLEAALAHPEAYAELRAAERKQIQASLDQMGSQLDASGSLQALADEQRSALLAEQARINGVLDTARSDSRLVCTREKTMGSNFRRTVCMTVAQRRRNSEQAQGMVRSESGGSL